MVKRPRSQQPNGQGHTPLCTGAPLPLAQGYPLGPGGGPLPLGCEERLRNRPGALPKAANSTLPLD